MRHARKLSPLKSPLKELDEVIRQIVRAELHRFLCRCHICKHLFAPDEVSVYGCRCCFTGIAVTCEKCGGKDRSIAAITAHARWYSCDRGTTFDNGAHREYWRAYRDQVARRMKLRIVK